MSSAISLMIFGQVYLLGPLSNTSSTTLTLTIYQNQTEPTEISPAVVRDGYTYIPGLGTYKVHTNALPWHKARKICTEEGGHLAVLNSEAEVEKISELARKAEYHDGKFYRTQFHIGIHNLYDKDEWVTIQGESLEAAGYSEWYEGEPNRNGLGCGAISYTNNKLYDSSFQTSLGFICELS